MAARLPALWGADVSERLPFEKTRTEIEQSVRAVDVKRIMDAAEKQAEEAFAAGDRPLELQSVELQMRALRRMGQLLYAEKEAKELFIAKGRKYFRPGVRQPCHLCGKFEYVA